MRKSTIVALALTIALATPQKLNGDRPIFQEPKLLSEVREVVKKKEVVQEVKQEVKEDKPNYINIRVSYYTNSVADCGNTKGITASGKNLSTLSRGGSMNDITYIAVPKNIPFGTKFYVEGIGLCEAVDTGSAIKWHGDTMWIDVFVPKATHQELQSKGVMKTKGYIIK